MDKISIVVPLGIRRKIEYPESIINQKKDIALITEFGKNPSKNRNRGIKRARTEIIAFINGHTILSKNWSEKVIQFFNKNKKVDIVGGPQMTPEDDNGFAKISGYALASKFGAWKISNRYSGEELILDADETMLTSANLICRKKVFKRVKFDETIYPGEDPKFVSDAKHAGFKIAYSPEIIVYNRRRSSFKELAKQIFNYGKTRMQKESFKETLKMPFFLVPGFFLIYLILLIFAFLLNFSSLIILAPLVAYTALDIIFSLTNATINKSILALFLLPIIYPIIHLSYGAGIIYGSIRKKRK